MNSLFFKFIVILSIILLSSCNAPLSDSRVLSVLVSEDDNQTRTIFVGTDGGGMNWGRVEKENILPANWHRVRSDITPGLFNDHFRFMFLTPLQGKSKVLYAATYNGISYAIWSPDDGFGEWETINKFNFLSGSTERVRSVHISRNINEPIDMATMYIGTDKGLWSIKLDSKGSPKGNWINVGFDNIGITTIYTIKNKRSELIIAGTSKNGLVVGMRDSNDKIIWTIYSKNNGLPSNNIWDVYATGSKVGDIILIGTNGGGIAWATIKSSQKKVVLSSWKIVNNKEKGFSNNSNAQVYLSGNKVNDIVWVATRSGLSWSKFDNNLDLRNWQTAKVKGTTNDIGSVKVYKNIVYLGIYRTGIAAAKFNKGTFKKWVVETGSMN